MSNNGKEFLDRNLIEFRAPENHHLPFNWAIKRTSIVDCAVKLEKIDILNCEIVSDADGKKTSIGANGERSNKNLK